MAVRIEHSSSKFFEEFRELIEFFSRSPFILTNEGLTSDSFVQMRDFVQSNPENLTAQIFFKSVEDEFIRFGEDTSVYFKFLKFFSEKVLTGILSPKQAKLQMLSLYNNLNVVVDQAVSYGDFEDLEISTSVLDAILEADGSIVRIEKSEHDSISQDSGFQFPIHSRQEFYAEDAKVLILEHNIDPSTILRIAQQVYPQDLVVIGLGNSNNLARFEEANPDKGFKFVVARPEYKDQDFAADLKRLVNQTLSKDLSKFDVQDFGFAVSIKCSGGFVTIQSEPSFLLKRYIKSLVTQMNQEQSTLRRQQLQARISNLSEVKTVINLGAGSLLEFDAKSLKTVSEILRVTNILHSGYVKSSIFSPDFDNIPFNVFKDLFEKAATDVYFAMSTTRIIQI